MSLDELFEAKKRLYPQAAKGRFRRLKWILNSVFLSIYTLTPFLRFNRGVGAPDQAILIDLANSRAYFFNIEIWPQEVYYFMGILIIAAVALFFVTSLFGRIWCGYACFQTVWTDIFIGCEKLFQGDRNARILLDRKNNFKKFYKKSLTHLSWIFISLITGFAFVSYFNDVFVLIKNALNFTVSFNVLGWILGIAAATYIMAGFAREHVCTYMCPYARFQSAMFDRNTLIITYDEKRGEPRNKYKQGESFANRGACIDCKQCVVVCPTGIDIRNGLQMECIACGLCVDACDEVMDKIGQPRGLIRYDTENNLEIPSPQNRFRLLKPRTFYYGGILLLVSFLMIRSLVIKPTLEASAIADRNPLFVTLSDGSIRNGYNLKIANKTHQIHNYQVSVISPASAQLKVLGYTDSDENNFPIHSEDIKNFKIYITLPSEYLSAQTQDEIRVKLLIKSDNQEEKNVDLVFVWK